MTETPRGNWAQDRNNRRRYSDMKGSLLTPMGIVFMFIVSAAAVTGIGYGFWSQALTVTKTVDTGSVALEYTGAFTNDDALTTGGSVDLDDDDTMPQAFDYHATSSSADPRDRGPEATSTATSTLRYDKDIARCVASHVPGQPTASLAEDNVYPSYWCTAWFDVVNSGSVPVKVGKVILRLSYTSTVVDILVDPDSATTTLIDLDNNSGDNDPSTNPDVEVDVDDIQLCEQIDPGDSVRFTVHQHLLDEAPQGGYLGYQVLVEMA